MLKTKTCHRLDSEVKWTMWLTYPDRVRVIATRQGKLLYLLYYPVHFLIFLYYRKPKMLLSVGGYRVVRLRIRRPALCFHVNCVHCSCCMCDYQRVIYWNPATKLVCHFLRNLNQLVHVPGPAILQRGYLKIYCPVLHKVAFME